MKHFKTVAFLIPELNIHVNVQNSLFFIVNVIIQEYHKKET